MTDEPNNAELGRNINRLREDTRDDIAGLREQLRGDLDGLRQQVAGMVSQSQHVADMRTINQRVDHVDKGLSEAKRGHERAADIARQARHTSIAAVVAGLGVLVSVIALFSNAPTVSAGWSALLGVLGG